MNLKNEFAHLVSYVHFDFNEIRFKLNSSRISDPLYAENFVALDEAIESLSLVTRFHELPPHVPRPRAQSMVAEFAKKVHVQGYTNVSIQLPSWGKLQVEVSVLKRDEAVLDVILPALVQMY